MPVSPPSHYPTDRRASSPKRASDVTKSAHPVVTKAAYDAVIRGTGHQENLKVKRLCQLRNLLSQYLLLIDASLRDHNPQLSPQLPATYNALRQNRTYVERAFLRFPLKVENK